MTDAGAHTAPPQNPARHMSSRKESSGKPRALQTLCEIRGRQAVAPALGLSVLQHRFNSMFDVRRSTFQLKTKKPALVSGLLKILKRLTSFRPWFRLI